MWNGADPTISAHRCRQWTCREAPSPALVTDHVEQPCRSSAMRPPPARIGPTGRCDAEQPPEGSVGVQAGGRRCPRWALTWSLVPRNRFWSRRAAKTRGDAARSLMTSSTAPPRSAGGAGEAPVPARSPGPIRSLRTPVPRSAPAANAAQRCPVEAMLASARPPVNLSIGARRWPGRDRWMTSVVREVRHSQQAVRRRPPRSAGVPERCSRALHQLGAMRRGSVKPGERCGSARSRPLIRMVEARVGLGQSSTAWRCSPSLGGAPPLPARRRRAGTGVDHPHAPQCPSPGEASAPRYLAAARGAQSPLLCPGCGSPGDGGRREPRRAQRCTVVGVSMALTRHLLRNCRRRRGIRLASDGSPPCRQRA